MAKPETELERYQRELEAINRLPNRVDLLFHIFDLQGESPRDKCWPTEGGNEPEPEEGWDPSGTHHYATVHALYNQLVAEGKITPEASSDGKTRRSAKKHRELKSSAKIGMLPPCT